MCPRGVVRVSVQTEPLHVSGMGRGHIGSMHVLFRSVYSAGLWSA